MWKCIEANLRDAALACCEIAEYKKSTNVACNVKSMNLASICFYMMLSLYFLYS